MRSLREKLHSPDVVVVGGGLSGLCCAVSAARLGQQVVLVQDRPVLGGNASSEVRLWVLGATSHMGNNNRWAREGGLIDEILVENMWRNPEGNAVIFDSLLLEFVAKETNVTLLLNTAMIDVEMASNQTIGKVRAFCSQNQTVYTLSAPLFVDASGDGILGFLAGAEFRTGAEARSEFGEALGGIESSDELLGHSLYFYSRDTGAPVQYFPPSFALKDIKQIPRYRELRSSDTGCRLWWLEYGGRLDTVHDTEEIKWELWKVAYGVWNHIKNSGEFPEAENLTLEWMGMIPGKRESRRFVGDFLLSQRDIIDQTIHTDAVSFGGWAIDLHPSEGVYSPHSGCTQWHSKGVYQIPYRTMYSKNVHNLFITGRLLSASHIAFGSTRVMATCAHNGQAVGVAAALCNDLQLSPRALGKPAHMDRFQQELLRFGQHIPGLVASDPRDLAKTARISASSSLQLGELPPSGECVPCTKPYALLIPMMKGEIPTITLSADVKVAATFRGELWGSAKPGNTTPDQLLAVQEIDLHPGKSVPVRMAFDISVASDCHVFIVIPTIEGVQLYLSELQVTGLLTLSQKQNAAVAKSPVQIPPPDSGVETFAFWLPDRRPEARNLAARIDPPLSAYEPQLVTNGYGRPWCGANCWIPALEDHSPHLRLSWPTKQIISNIQITFDTDFDHPMESVLMIHPECIMPACIAAFRVYNDIGEILVDVRDNHQTLWRHKFPTPAHTKEITIEVLGHGPAPPAIFEVRCY